MVDRVVFNFVSKAYQAITFGFVLERRAEKSNWSVICLVLILRHSIEDRSKQL